MPVSSCPVQRGLIDGSAPMQVTIISIAIMNIWKLFKAPYNISTVGVVRIA